MSIKIDGSGTVTGSVNFLTSPTIGTSAGGGPLVISRQDSAGTEGGEIQFARGSDNSTMYVMDVYGSGDAPSLRIFNGQSAAVLFTCNTTGSIGLGTTTPGGKLDVNGSILGAMPELFQSRAIVTTSDNRSLGSSASWTDHMSVGFTVTKSSPVFVNVVFAMTYEADTVHGESRVELRGTATRTSDAFSVAQQSDQNRARGAHSFTYFFGNVAAGSYTAYLQVRNSGGGTWILNNYIGYDTMSVHYM